MRVIGVRIKNGVFPFNGGDRILSRNFLHEVDAVKFALANWEGGEMSQMILLNIDKEHPKVIAVLGLKKG